MSSVANGRAGLASGAGLGSGEDLAARPEQGQVGEERDTDCRIERSERGRRATPGLGPMPISVQPSMTATATHRSLTPRTCTSTDMPAIAADSVTRVLTDA